MTPGAIGLGFTVMTKLWPGPAQPLVGVTVMVAVIGEVPVFSAVKLGMLPLPLAANPIAVLLFVHVKLVPATELLKAIPPVCTPAQNDCAEGAITSGAALTVIVLVAVVEPHSFVTVSEIVYVPEVV